MHILASRENKYSMGIFDSILNGVLQGVVDTWSLGQFGEYLVDRYGRNNAEAVFKRIKNVILNTLLITEPSVAPHFNGLTLTEELYR